MEHTDVCYAPVLTMSEAAEHPHNRAREAFVTIADHVQPAPAPRYSETRPETPEPAPMPGDDSEAVLKDIGLNADEIARLREAGAVG